MSRSAQSQDRELVVLGRIRTTHGVRGWLKVQSFSDNPEVLFSTAGWLLNSDPIDTGSKPKRPFEQVELAEWKQSGNDLLVRLKGLDNREEAARYRQQFIHLPSEALPDLAEDEVYWHQLEGMQVYNLARLDRASVDSAGVDSAGADSASVVGEGSYDRAEHLGIVDHMLETGANDVLVIEPKDPLAQASKEKLMVPYVIDYSVLEVDTENRRILIDWIFE